MLIKKSYL